MFLSLVIGRFKGYLRCKYSKNNKSIKNKLIYFNLINLSTVLLITNCNNDIMRQLLKFMNYAAQLMALISLKGNRLTLLLSGFQKLDKNFYRPEQIQMNESWGQKTSTGRWDVDSCYQMNSDVSVV